MNAATRSFFAALLALAFAATAGHAQAVPSEHANQARIDSLLKQMTIEEKMNLIRGGLENLSTYQGQAGYLPGVPRLHVPSLRMADGPPGLLTRVPAQAEAATMGVAATFSKADAEANGVVIGREARSLGIDVVLQPFINIERDITFARAYNTFGEDPYLAGVMGAAEIHGEQAQDVMAMAKHYIGYDSDSYNVFVDQQALHEVYAAPFDEAIKAGVSSVMCSYNHVNGPFACGNADTLKTILKGQMGFKGFVASDWGGVHSVTFINEGLDMEMPGAEYSTNPLAPFTHNFFITSEPTAKPAKPDMVAIMGMLGGSMPEEPKSGGMDIASFPLNTDHTTMMRALKDGTVSEATITAAARRVLYEMDRFGYLDGKQKHTITTQDIEANAVVIRKTAEDAAVLLKNDGALPLKSDDLNSLALIGPTAGQVDAIGTFGERSGGLVERQVGPLDALRYLAPNAHITYAVDDDMTGHPIPADKLSHAGQSGLLRTNAKGGASSTDGTLNFTHSNNASLPANSEYTWKGTLTVAADGDYWLYLQVLGARGILIIDGKEIGRSGSTLGTVHGDIQQAAQDNVIPTTDGLDNVRRAVHLTAGAHALTVATTGDSSNNPEQIRLNWTTPQDRERDHQVAIAAARSVHTAVVFLWTRGRPAFGLPGEQDKLVEEIAGANPNTIVVLNTSQPIAMPWIGKVKGVLEMWWPGDEGGWSTADLLLGKANPAGRLPVTWAKRLTDYAATDPAHPERSAKGVDGKTTFSEGVDVGYRSFDKQNIAPLYPFGSGLSYTTFRYSDLKAVKAAGGGVDLTLKIKNTGPVTGDEVPQVYLDAPAHQPNGVQFAPKTLAAFDRITLAPGETRIVKLHIAPRAYEYWSTAETKWVRAADRRIQVGSSSRDIKLNTRTP